MVTFFDYVRGSLIPKMLPFCGENCSIHHVQKVIQLFRDAGILVLFLPPYSPDYANREDIQLCETLLERP